LGYKSVLTSHNEKIEFSKKVSNKTGMQKSKTEKEEWIKLIDILRYKINSNISVKKNCCQRLCFLFQEESVRKFHKAYLK
jgi:hypothetical protein